MSLLQKLPFQHVGYLVRDREAACQRLGALYGLDQWTMIDYKPQKAKCYGEKFEGYFVKAAIHPPTGGCGVEIIQPVSEGMHMDFFRKDSNGINHVCHTTEEYDHYLEHFISKGCELIFEAEMEDEIRGYRRCGYAYDPVLCVVFELAEVPRFRK